MYKRQVAGGFQANLTCHDMGMPLMKPSPLACGLESLLSALRLNMRVHLTNNLRARQYAGLPMLIGDSNLKERDEKIKIVGNLCSLVSDFQSVVWSVYPDHRRLSEKDMTWLRERVILTSKNDSTAHIIEGFLLYQQGFSYQYQQLLEDFIVKKVTYQSIDSAVEVNNGVHYTSSSCTASTLQASVSTSTHLKVCLLYTSRCV